MKKSLLITFLVLWYLVAEANSESVTLPSLPDSGIAENVMNPKSIWQRVIIFLGIEEDQKVKESFSKDHDSTGQNNEVPAFTQSNVKKEETPAVSEINSSNNQPSNDLGNPVTEGSKNDKTLSKATQSAPAEVAMLPEKLAEASDNKDKNSDLKLPEGFAPDEETKPTNKLQTSQASATEKASSSEINPKTIQELTPPVTNEPDKGEHKDGNEPPSTTSGVPELPKLPENQANIDNSATIDASGKDIEQPTAKKEDTNKYNPDSEKADVKEPADNNNNTQASSGTDGAENISPKPLIEEGKKDNAGESDSKISLFRKQLRDRLNNNGKLPQINSSDITSSGSETTSTTTTLDNLSAEQQKFVSDEAQVLGLPNDDVVLGEMTMRSELEQMDFSSYVKLFWKNYDNLKNKPERELIDDFIKKHDNHKSFYTEEELATAFQEAERTIVSGNVYELMDLINNYPILQRKNHNGESLLHIASQNRNYFICKLLMAKGINTSLRNFHGKTAMDIAIQSDFSEIVNLLKR